MFSFDDICESATFTGIVDYIKDLHQNIVDKQTEKCSDGKLLGEILQMEEESSRVQFTVARFQHSGKFGTQKKSFQYLEKNLPKKDQQLILFLDSDTTVYRNTISELVDFMERRSKNSVGTTCMVHCKTSDRFNILHYLQDVEYSQVNLLIRQLENYLGAVSCLPGVCTMIRFEVLAAVSGDYFSDDSRDDCKNTFDYFQKHLGEDRYLTNLLIMMNPKQHGRSTFCSSAKCKTEPVSSLSGLIRQRRRWILGTLPNQLQLITSPKIWTSMPLLAFEQLLYSIVPGGSLFYVFLIHHISEYFDTSLTLEIRQSRLIGFLIGLGVAIVPIWIPVVLYSVSRKRLKMIFMFPVLFLVQPFLNMLYAFDAIKTVRKRTWGGVRAK